MATCISYMICLLSFLLVFIDLGASLKCYECKSAFNGDCDDVRGKTITEEDCSNSKLVKAFPEAGVKYVCVIHKMAQRAEVELSVVRGCAPDDYCARFKDSKQCTTCQNDLCNSSSAVLPSIVLSIVSFLGVKYYL